MTERARALLIAELDKAVSNLVLDIAEMRSRRAGPGAMALLDDTLSVLADTREQLTETTAQGKVA